VSIFSSYYLFTFPVYLTVFSLTSGPELLVAPVALQMLPLLGVISGIKVGDVLVLKLNKCSDMPRLC